MRIMVAAGAAGLASVVVHGGVEMIAAASGALPPYLTPVTMGSIGRYLLTFALQAVVLVGAYLIVGNSLPGRSMIQRGIAFGTLLFFFGACLPLAPMVLVFRQPFPPDFALEGIVGGVLVSFAKGVAFVVTWESVMERLQRQHSDDAQNSPLSV